MAPPADEGIKTTTKSSPFLGTFCVIPSKLEYRGVTYYHGLFPNRKSGSEVPSQNCAKFCGFFFWGYEGL
jgi:hypothetical protein